MRHGMRELWRGGKPWLAAGFLAATGLFVLLIYFSWIGDRRSIAQQQATGLGAVTTGWDPVSLWQRRGGLGLLSRMQPLRALRPSAFVGGIPGGAESSQPSATAYDTGPDPASVAEKDDRQVIRTGTLRIIVARPGETARKLDLLVESLGGFVLSSTIAGGSGRDQSAAVVMRVPASRFDDMRQQIRALASDVERDSSEARDVTREYGDQQAVLRNLRATEGQYLALFQRAGRADEIAKVAEKLSGVRGEIERLTADLHYVEHQVAMSMLTVELVPAAAAMPLHWRPLHEARASMKSALMGFADYFDSIIALLFHVPVILLWTATILLLLRIGLWVLMECAPVYVPDAPIVARSVALTLVKIFSATFCSIIRLCT